MNWHNKIYELDLFEAYAIDEDSFIERVPGGWLYFVKDKNGLMPPIFLPYNEEFRSSDLPQVHKS